ncbi:hypothetical protein [Metabacillus malikii]|uniref:Uncharacterized protein n=1 Tax=Metabacillus malikii TaxID=1504265 RepID=A0ABT9ZEB8_9BACI|nr:hypothetical protein [Metabacillus malikii]MDQ0230197.1 hypothetical protein [Metabacillus malikii]
MNTIAKYARLIYLLAILLMFVKTFYPIKQVYNIVFNILFVLIVIPVLFIEYKFKK